MSDKLIIIGGGVGPMAGVKFHEILIENTKTQGRDQDHLPVIHISLSSNIADRSVFLKQPQEENPAEGMFYNIQSIAKATKAFNIPAVLGIPCNTFHAPAIFSRFEDLLRQLPEIQLISMLYETAHSIKILAPHANKIGLMSTSGTREARIYHEVLEPQGYEIIQVEKTNQQHIHDAIYHPTWGIKAQSTNISSEVQTRLHNSLQELASKGAEVIILGCTELPLALPSSCFEDIPLLDPMCILARALISASNPDKLLLS